MQIDHERATKELERKVAILTRLTEISTVLSSTLRLKPLLNSIMDAAAEVTEAEAASVLLWDQKTNELRFAATTTASIAAELFGKPVPLDGSIAGLALRERRVLMLEDVGHDSRHYAKVDRDIAFETRSLLVVPMTVKNRVIGVLEAVNKRDLPWTQDDANYLSILAAQAAVAIESAQLVMQLQMANDELSQLDKLKSDFIAIASHELRTPLGVILGYASFLQETPDTQVSENATRVVTSAMQLRNIIEDLTNLRYLQSQEADLHREALRLADLFRDIEYELLPRADSKNHTLRFVAPPPDLRVHADRIRLGMALTHVINNAIRFTPARGQIIVQAEMHNRHEAWISVADNGIGIARDQIERIFDTFYQIEDHMTRRHGGLGVGLSIARALIEAHGGRIWAASPGLNQGATFTLSVPLYADRT